MEGNHDTQNVEPRISTTKRGIIVILAILAAFGAGWFARGEVQDLTEMKPRNLTEMGRIGVNCELLAILEMQRNGPVTFDVPSPNYEATKTMANRCVRESVARITGQPVPD